MAKITKEDRLELARAIRDHKRAKEKLRQLGVKELEKQINQTREVIREIVNRYEQDFDTPYGHTDSRPTRREYYDTEELDELLESGTIDPDTAFMIRKTRKVVDNYSLYIL